MRHVHHFTAQIKNTAVQFGRWSNTWQVTDCRIMGRGKWLFVNGSEYKGLISQDGIFKLGPRPERCISVLGDCAEK